MSCLLLEYECFGRSKTIYLDEKETKIALEKGYFDEAQKDLFLKLVSKNIISKEEYDRDNKKRDIELTKTLIYCIHNFIQ